MVNTKKDKHRLEDPAARAAADGAAADGAAADGAAADGAAADGAGAPGRGRPEGGEPDGAGNGAGTMKRREYGARMRVLHGELGYGPPGLPLRHSPTPF